MACEMTYLRLTLMLGLASVAVAADVESVAPAAVRELALEPARLEFSGPGDRRRVLVLGVTEGGERIDLTKEAEFNTHQAASLVGTGLLRGESPGSGVVTVEARGFSAELPFETARGDSTRRVSFIRDVMPVLNKVGCTGGPCHGSAKGKNGFKLSLRGYDPVFDYKALLYDLSGRRFNRADPARSLMLTKPSQEVAHGGGLRLENGSQYYETILTWIEQNAPFGAPESDSVVSLEILPKEIFMHSPGRDHRVIVVAQYRDGSTRDVTAEAVIASSNTETVKVSDNVVSGLRSGESTLLFRYEGKFAAIPVTVLNPRTGFEWSALPQNNYIDELVDTKLRRLKIQPSPLAPDDAFLRRVSLDLTGKLPEPDEVYQFLADGSADKRARKIDELIGSPEFVDYWTLKWGDLLRSNRKFLSDKGMWGFREWIRGSVETNKPYDIFVRELLTSKGSSFANPAANFYRVARDPKEAMETATQLFLGVRMVCAQCHDHPFERWTQNQYYEMAAFFSAVGVRPGFQSGEEIVYLKRSDNQIEHPVDGRLVEPRYLVAVADAPSIVDQHDQRDSLVGWLTSKQNPFFAMAIANRVFSYFLGRGIIDPVDDIRASNPPINPDLLAALTKDVTANDFDLQHLMRTILNSRVYQSSVETNVWNEGDAFNFSHFMPRRLSAEQLVEGIALATGSDFALEGVPEDFTATQSPDPHAGMGGFLDLFGRPQRETACECERKAEMSLPQTMNLVNGPTLADAIADPGGRIASLVLRGTDDRDLVEELYLTTLSRRPTAAEYDLAITHLAGPGGRTAAAQDLMWALLNSNAFLFNR